MTFEVSILSIVIRKGQGAGGKGVSRPLPAVRAGTWQSGHQVWPCQAMARGYGPDELSDDAIRAQQNQPGVATEPGPNFCDYQARSGKRG